MLYQNAFLKKSKKGVLKVRAERWPQFSFGDHAAAFFHLQVVREHYLREDIWCVADCCGRAGWCSCCGSVAGPVEPRPTMQERQPPRP
jgi:hypothetical protein